MRAVFIKVLLLSLAHLPLTVLHKLGQGVGYLLFKFSNKTKRIATINIQHCFPHKSPQEQEKLLKDSLVETAKTFIETSAVWYRPKDKLCQLLHETDSVAPLKAVAQSARAAIVLTPHIGAWEMAGLYCAQLGPTTALYRPPRQASIAPIIQQGREHLGLKLAPTNQNGIRQLSRALKKHELVGILPDQDPGKNGGIFAPFFTKPANTMTLVSRLALKTQCPVFCIYAERLSRGRGYLIHCIEAPPELSNSDLETSVIALNGIVEKCVNHLPTQYQWGYKRFKNQPEGMPDIYAAD